MLVLIEEYAPDDDGKKLTADDDIDNKMNDVINQIMYELCRIKKIPKFIEMNVTAGDVIDFETLAEKCGYDIYQIKLVTGVDYEPRADGTILKMLESGTAEIDVFVYPEAITRKTSNSYEFELSADALEIMPYGIAADLLKSDVSAEYGTVYATRYESMKAQLDPRYYLTSVYIEGGVI